MSFVIRRMIECDLEEVTKLMNDNLAFGTSTIEFNKSQLEDKNVVNVVAETLDGIIGYASAYNHHNETDLAEQILSIGYKESDVHFLFQNGIDSTYSSLNKVVVKEEYRKQGIAGRLMICLGIDNYYSLIWINKDMDVHTMQSKFPKSLLINEYWTEDKVPCPQCEPYCKCSALLIIK